MIILGVMFAAKPDLLSGDIKLAFFQDAGSSKEIVAGKALAYCKDSIAEVLVKAKQLGRIDQTRADQLANYCDSYGSAPMTREAFALFAVDAFGLTDIKAPWDAAGKSRAGSIAIFQAAAEEFKGDKPATKTWVSSSAANIYKALSAQR